MILWPQPLGMHTARSPERVAADLSGLSECGLSKQVRSRTLASQDAAVADAVLQQRSRWCMCTYSYFSWKCRQASGTGPCEIRCLSSVASNYERRIMTSNGLGPPNQLTATTLQRCCNPRSGQAISNQMCRLSQTIPRYQIIPLATARLRVILPDTRAGLVVRYN